MDGLCGEEEAFVEDLGGVWGSLVGDGEGDVSVGVCGSPSDGCGVRVDLDLCVGDAVVVLVVDGVGDGGLSVGADRVCGVCGEGECVVADALCLVGVVGVLSVDFDEVVAGW